MLKKYLIRKYNVMLLAVVFLLLTAGASFAAVFNLRAEATTKTMPDTGEVITMWGFAQVTDPVTVPGPLLTVPAGDATLTINLTNNLSVPVSLIVPGQNAVMSPAWAGGRVMSLNTETAPGATHTYSWSNVRPGTYMYQSGTNSAVQVQMGLYGGVKIDAAANEVYTGEAYDSEVVLFYSEIDPVLHTAIDTAVAGNLWGTAGFPSTIDYSPRYFLINGEPYSGGTLPLSAGNINDRVLIRFLNAGLQTHIPQLLGGYLKIIAEDGRQYPHKKNQYSLILPAGKTIDAVFSPAAAGTYPVYDRTLGLKNAVGVAGGMLAFLSVAAPPSSPVAADDPYTTVEDTALTADGVTIAGVLGNDTGSGTLNAVLVSGATGGSLTLNPDGTFTYMPNLNFNGTDTFTYRARDLVSLLESNTATVRIAVTPANDAPAANADAYTATATVALNIAAPGVLSNDSDADANPLTAVLAGGPASGGTLTCPATLLPGLCADGSFSYLYPTNPAATVSDTFSYYANDGTADSAAPATVTITVNPRVNTAPVAVNDAATTRKNTLVNIYVTLNDYDPDGSINTASVSIVTKPKKGTVSVDASGTVTYTPNLNFRGTDPFTYKVMDNEGAVSNTAKVTVNVVK